MQCLGDMLLMAYVLELYACRQCDAQPEAWRAIDNVPKHAHLCEACAMTVPADVFAHYRKVEEPDLIAPIEHIEVLEHQEKHCGGLAKCRVCWLEAKTSKIRGKDWRNECPAQLPAEDRECPFAGACPIHKE